MADKTLPDQMREFATEAEKWFDSINPLSQAIVAMAGALGGLKVTSAAAGGAFTATGKIVQLLEKNIKSFSKETQGANKSFISFSNISSLLFKRADMLYSGLNKLREAYGGLGRMITDTTGRQAESFAESMLKVAEAMVSSSHAIQVGAIDVADSLKLLNEVAGESGRGLEYLIARVGKEGGVGEVSLGNSLQFLRRGLGLAGGDIEKIATRVIATGGNIENTSRVIMKATKKAADMTGLSQKLIAKDTAAIMEQTSKFGTMTAVEAVKAATALRRMGLEMKSINSFADNLDTFEGAAQAVGKLTQIMPGLRLNPYELMKADPIKKLKMVRTALDGIGFDYMSANRQAKIYVQGILNMDDATAQAYFSNRKYGSGMDEVAQAMEEAARKGTDVKEELKLIRMNAAAASGEGGIGGFGDALKKVGESVAKGIAGIEPLNALFKPLLGTIHTILPQITAGISTTFSDLIGGGKGGGIIGKSLSNLKATLLGGKVDIETLVKGGMEFDMEKLAKEGEGGLLGGFTQTLTDVGDNFQKTLPKMITAYQNSLKEGGVEFKPKQFIQEILGFDDRRMAIFAKSLDQTLSGMITNILPVILGIAKKIQPTITKLRTGLNQMFKGEFEEGAKTMIGGAKLAMGNLEGIIDLDMTKKAIEGLEKDWLGPAEAAVEKASKVVEGALGEGKKAAGEAAAHPLMKMFKDMLGVDPGKIFETMGDKVVQAGESINTKVGPVFDKLITTIQLKIAELRATMFSGADILASAAEKIAKTMALLPARLGGGVWAATLLSDVKRFRADLVVEKNAIEAEVLKLKRLQRARIIDEHGAPPAPTAAPGSGAPVAMGPPAPAGRRGRELIMHVTLVNKEGTLEIAKGVAKAFLPMEMVS